MARAAFAAFPALLAIGGLAGCSGASGADDNESTSAEALVGGRVGAVFTMTNDPSGNEIVAFRRAADGTLQEAARYATTGKGSGDALASQGSLTASEDGRFLFAVNAGSNELSVFSVQGESLYLEDTEPSGGTRPISVAVSHGVAYVVHAGAGANAISGFTYDADGKLTAIAGSTRSLGTADVGPAQIGFSTGGHDLFVSEKMTNSIAEITLDWKTRAPSSSVVLPSNGQTPFGFAVSSSDRLIVSEAFGGAAGASALSSYAVTSSKKLTTISASVADTQTAACWVAVFANEVLTTNTASGTVSAYWMSADGHLTLRTNGGVDLSTGAGSKPTDIGVTADGAYLYVVDSGTGQLTSARRDAKGGLTTVAAVANLSALPATTTGLVAF